MSSPSPEPGQNTELHVFYYFGATITLASSLFVIFSYMKFRACRQHPSSLIFWRSMSDVIFSLQFIILFSRDDGRRQCKIFSFLFQFSVLASQSWYFMNAVDLLRSMRNPFTDPKQNIPLYHVFVWSISLVTAIVIDAKQKDAYRSDMQICWTSTSDGSLINYVNWLTFFIPTLCYYFFSIGTVAYAGLRLRAGLQETFLTRRIVLFNGIRYVAGFCAYWTFAGIIYGIIILRSQSTNPNPDDPTKTEPTAQNSLGLYATFAVTIAFRGVVDVCIWIYNQRVLIIYKKWWAGEPHDNPSDIGLAETDINRALRREVLIFSTTGIVLSIDRANSVPFSADVLPTIEQYPSNLDCNDTRNMHSIIAIDVHRDDFSQKMLNFLPNLGLVSHNVLAEAREVAEAQGPDGVPFFDFGPQVFRFLRFQHGIDEGEYARSIQGKDGVSSLIEKFTEGGRSGSFFYFSEDGKYIVKTLTVTESIFLVKWLPKYVEYMSKNRNSLLSRFCGFHSLRLYNLTIYFMVMQSVFQTKRKIHERYDLKGSWIDRHADTTASSSSISALKLALSRNGITDKKRLNGLRSGGFKNVVYKDNDLNRTVRLSDKDRLLFLHQVRKDAYFLRDSNIMDFSLLLGVHHTSHVVPLMSPTSSPSSPVGVNGNADVPRGAASTTTTHHPTTTTNGRDLITLSPPPLSHTPPLSIQHPVPHHPSSLINGGISSPSAASVTTSPPLPTAASNGAASSSSSVLPRNISVNLTNQGIFCRDEGGVQASIIEGPGIYFFGLIDILQEYDTKKKLERFAKKYLRFKDGDGISSMPPDGYADRFVHFMSNITREEDETLGRSGMTSPLLSASSMGDSSNHLPETEAELDAELQKRGVNPSDDRENGNYIPTQPRYTRATSQHNLHQKSHTPTPPPQSNRRTTHHVNQLNQDKTDKSTEVSRSRSGVHRNGGSSMYNDPDSRSRSGAQRNGHSSVVASPSNASRERIRQRHEEPRESIAPPPTHPRESVAPPPPPPMSSYPSSPPSVALASVVSDESAHLNPIPSSIITASSYISSPPLASDSFEIHPASDPTSDSNPANSYHASRGTRNSSGVLRQAAMQLSPMYEQARKSIEKGEPSSV